MKNVFEEWKQEEDQLLYNSVLSYGKKWSLIKQLFPNKSYSCVKNRWYSYLSKKVNEKNEENSEKCLFPDSKFNFHLDMILFKSVCEQEVSWISGFPDEEF